MVKLSRIIAKAIYLWTFLTATTLFLGCSSYKYFAFTATEQGEVAERIVSISKKITDLSISGNIGDRDMASISDLASTSDILTIIDLSGSNAVLPHHAFAGCSYLKDIRMPIRSMTIIPHHCFSGCTNLKKVSFPSQCNTIEELAFHNCLKLKEIRLPKTTESIGKEAFKNCSSLSIIYCDSKQPPLCNSSAFIGINPYCKLIVPKGATSNYKNAVGWENIKFIQENKKRLDY